MERLEDYANARRNLMAHYEACAPFEKISEILHLSIRIVEMVQSIHACGVVNLKLNESTLCLNYEDSGMQVAALDFSSCASTGQSTGRSMMGDDVYMAPETKRPIYEANTWAQAWDLAWGRDSRCCEWTAHPSQDVYSVGVTILGLMGQKPLSTTVRCLQLPLQ